MKKKEIPPELSLEQKAELFDQIAKLMGDYYKKTNKKEKPKENKYKGTIPFEEFESIYARMNHIPATRKEWNSMNDEERRMAIDMYPTYRDLVAKKNPKEPLLYMLGSNTYLSQKKYMELEYDSSYIENNKPDYTNIELFAKTMNMDGGMELLKRELGIEKYLEVKKAWLNKE